MSRPPSRAVIEAVEQAEREPVATLIEAAEKRGAQRALAELDDRLSAARAELKRMAGISDEAGHPNSAARLHGKSEGVGLARSYLFDAQRAEEVGR